MTVLSELIDVYLQPGELYVAGAGFRLRTMLGSCVSITLWHAEARVGGMSHFLLPRRARDDASGNLDGRYGDEALQLMMAQLRAMGVPPAECQAKVFGGGDMFAHAGIARRTIQVGLRNGEAAQELLQAQGIQVVASSLFGHGHRQIVFNLSTGDVWSRQVRPSQLEVQTEKIARRSLR